MISIILFPLSCSLSLSLIQSESRGKEEDEGEVVVVVVVVLILVVCEGGGDVVDDSFVVAAGLLVVFSVFSFTVVVVGCCLWLFINCHQYNYTNKNNEQSENSLIVTFFRRDQKLTHRSNFPVQLYHEIIFLKFEHKYIGAIDNSMFI